MFTWLVTQRSAMPAPDHFLAPAEQAVYAQFTHARRQADWLHGRWTAKRLVHATCGADLPLTAIMVLSDADGAPYLTSTDPTIQRTLDTMQISLSHSGEHAACALHLGHTRLGIDLEQIAPRGAAFAQSYYTRAELDLLTSTPPDLYDTLATAIWSAKEATLKVTRHGLRVDTRSVTCLPSRPARKRAGYHGEGRLRGLASARVGGLCKPRPPVYGLGQGLCTCPMWSSITIRTALSPVALHGWWRTSNGIVITIVTEA
ncbi:4'-phosphopantetheinyl transferase family protein [Candidatus Oscillochloris fontis]|uniref:4'-phosphopantetheinyl transferase family protein n=1 Tax=Candidatus Oscillochloris fontis TaxID=2496868 RepID=UPI001375F1C5|nr:4'-phosphopantetheinyl transferase superfamily protein [Candidatus Oscillochloris fontis]